MDEKKKINDGMDETLFVVQFVDTFGATFSLQNFKYCNEICWKTLEEAQKCYQEQYDFIENNYPPLTAEMDQSKIVYLELLEIRPREGKEIQHQRSEKMWYYNYVC